MASQVVTQEQLPRNGVRSRPPQSPLLFDAIQDKNWSLAIAFIEENLGLGFESLSTQSNTVLHTAVLNNAPTEIVQMLLDKGLDVNRGNSMGRTPVYIAARHNVRISTMDLLIARGGDINKIDAYTYTPLMAAAYNGSSLALVGSLLRLGADANIKDNHQRTAAFWAKEGNFSEISTFLDNFYLMPVLCSVYVDRLGQNSALRMLPKEILRMIRNMVMMPNNVKKSD